MASHIRVEDDVEDFVCAPQLRRDNCLEALLADGSGTNDGTLPLPVLPLEVPPLPAGNLYECRLNFPSAPVNDLNMGINVNECPMDIPVEKVIADIDDDGGVPIQEHPGHGFSFSSARVNAIRSGHQTPNNVIAPYHVSMVTDFQNVVGANERNFNNSTCRGLMNFDMSVLHAETQNNGRQPIEMHNIFTNISGNAANKQVAVPRVYDNQVGVDSSLPNRLKKLDGRFLSLGYQSNVASNGNTNIFGRKADYVGEVLCSPQLANNSFNNVPGSLAEFQNNVGGLVTPWDSLGSQTFSGDDSFRAISSGKNLSLMSNLYGGPVNMRHHIPHSKQQNLRICY